MWFARLIPIPFVLVLSSLHAQLPQWQFVRSHDVLGKTPLMLFFGPREADPEPNSTAYVLCGGVDVNFNGQQDPGDESPSLTVAWGRDNTEVASLNFSFSWGPLSFPLRPAVAQEQASFTVYLPLMNRLLRYTFPPFGWPHEDTVLNGPAQAVAVSEGTLFVSRRNSAEPEIGLILVLRRDNVGIRVDTLRVYACQNIQQLVWDEARQQLIVLCEGQFGQRDAVAQFLPQGRDSGVTVVPVGGTGNFLLLSGDTLVVVSNGSHEVYLIDPSARLWHRMPIELGTTGYGGPREAVLLTLPNGQRTLLVSTYSRDVRWVDIATGQILQTLPLTGLGEGMA
ncbi:MAG: hypothetical protein RMJ46_04750, partial [Bacteroidota bacterium]|nr:hypothetical protein [Bacteroidota bacterium]